MLKFTVKSVCNTLIGCYIGCSLNITKFGNCAPNCGYLVWSSSLIDQIVNWVNPYVGRNHEVTHILHALCIGDLSYSHWEFHAAFKGRFVWEDVAKDELLSEDVAVHGVREGAWSLYDGAVAVSEHERFRYIDFYLWLSVGWDAAGRGKHELIVCHRLHLAVLGTNIDIWDLARFEVWRL